MLAVVLAVPVVTPAPASAGVVMETGKVCVLVPLTGDQVLVVVVDPDGIENRVFRLNERQLGGARFDCARLIDPAALLGGA